MNLHVTIIQAVLLIAATVFLVETILAVMGRQR